MIKVGIVGGTGYTGVELLRLLLKHPNVEIVAITSRGDAGRRLDDLFPTLRGRCDLVFSDPEQTALDDCDVVFFATPHNVAMRSVPDLLDKGVRIIDLSADFRLRDVAVWERWYGEAHTSPALCASAVYGLPEVYRETIRTAQLLACPGCYPTAVQLGFLPLLEANVIAPSPLIASCASGASGAGRQGKIDNLLTEAGDSFKAYGVGGHRHLPEIEQGLQRVNPAATVTFVPHLAPMSRGIHATLFATLTDEGVDLQGIFEQRYGTEPFVDVLPAGQLPMTRSVRGANMCQIAVTRPQQRNQVVVTVVIDNLVKGAAGQAVQAMNIMFSQDERTAIDTIALIP
jgi:N-acetyl-gamma-glutamyl-phosphate reductase